MTGWRARENCACPAAAADALASRSVPSVTCRGSRPAAASRWRRAAQRRWGGEGRGSCCSSFIVPAAAAAAAARRVCRAAPNKGNHGDSGAGRAGGPRAALRGWPGPARLARPLRCGASRPVPVSGLSRRGPALLPHLGAKPARGIPARPRLRRAGDGAVCLVPGGKGTGASVLTRREGPAPAKPLQADREVEGSLWAALACSLAGRWIPHGSAVLSQGVLYRCTTSAQKIEGLLSLSFKTLHVSLLPKGAECLYRCHGIWQAFLFINYTYKQRCFDQDVGSTCEPKPVSWVPLTP